MKQKDKMAEMIKVTADGSGHFICPGCGRKQCMLGGPGIYRCAQPETYEFLVVSCFEKKEPVHKVYDSDKEFKTDDHATPKPEKPKFRVLSLPDFSTTEYETDFLEEQLKEGYLHYSTVRISMSHNRYYFVLQ